MAHWFSQREVETRHLPRRALVPWGHMAAMGRGFRLPWGPSTLAGWAMGQWVAWSPPSGPMGACPSSPPPPSHSALCPGTPSTLRLAGAHKTPHITSVPSPAFQVASSYPLQPSPSPPHTPFHPEAPTGSSLLKLAWPTSVPLPACPAALCLWTTDPPAKVPSRPQPWPCSAHCWDAPAWPMLSQCPPASGAHSRASPTPHTSPTALTLQCSGQTGAPEGSHGAMFNVPAMPGKCPSRRLGGGQETLSGCMSGRSCDLSEG